MLKRSFLPALVVFLVSQLGAAATDHEPPIVNLHAPRGQSQQGALGNHRWWQPPNEGSNQCPVTEVADAPFAVGWPPVHVRPGARMLVRFQKETQPQSVEIHGPRGVIRATLQQHSSGGTVSAWDARFTAPSTLRRHNMVLDGKRRRFYVIEVLASWGEADCTWDDGPGGPAPSQRAEWVLSVKKRSR